MSTFSLCISGLPLQVTEESIRSELIQPHGLETPQLFIDKRRDGTTNSDEVNYAKCYVNITSDAPIKKVCSIMHKGGFGKQIKNLCVRPIAVIPISVVEECKRTGSNVIEDSQQERIVNTPRTAATATTDSRGNLNGGSSDYQQRNSNPRQKVARKEESNSVTLRGNNQDKSDDGSNSTYLVLSSFNEKSTKETVEDLVQQVNIPCENIHFDYNSGKPKAYVQTVATPNIGMKSFLAFVSKELKSKAGYKINVKHVTELPQNLNERQNWSSQSQYMYKHNRTAAESYNQRDRHDASHLPCSSAEYENSNTSGIKDSSNHVFFVITGLQLDCTVKWITNHLSRCAHVHVEAVRLNPLANQLKAYAEVVVAPSVDVQSFLSALSEDMSFEVGYKLKLFQISQMPPLIAHKSDSRRSKKKNDAVDIRQKDGSDSKYNDGSRDISNNDNQDGNFWNGKRPLSSHATTPYKPIIYYDPTDPSHKCYELDFEESKKKESINCGDTLEAAQNDEERTLQLKDAFSDTKSSSNGFVFGFSLNPESEKLGNNEDIVTENNEKDHEDDDEDLSEAEIITEESLPKQKTKPIDIHQSMLFALPSLDMLKSSSSGFFNPKPNDVITTESTQDSNSKTKGKKHDYNAKRKYDHTKSTKTKVMKLEKRT